MYLDSDCNISAEAFYQNVGQLHDRLHSIRTELKSHIEKLDGKVRRNKQTKIKPNRQEIQQIIGKSDKKTKEFAALAIEKSLQSIEGQPPCLLSVVGVDWVEVKLHLKLI